MTALEVKNEIHQPSKQLFMAKFDRYEPVVIDHTAIITAKKCLRMYFFQIVLGRVPRDEPVVFAWGSAYHKFREVLERAYGIGDEMPKQFDEPKAMEAFQKAMQAGIEYWQKNGSEQGPESNFSWMTSARLLRSFAVAFKHWVIEKKRGVIEVIAVEQPFNIELKDGTFRGGRADQIVRWSGRIWGRDFKTTSKDSAFYQRTLDPNEQFTGYTFCESKLTGGEQVQGQIVELLYNSKPTKKEERGPEIISLTASRTKWQLDEWEEDHAFWVDIIKMARERDRYPLSEVNCNWCPYHAVCKQGSEASQIYQLETSYKLRPWDHQHLGE